jgi:hypothetical protein
VDTWSLGVTLVELLRLWVAAEAARGKRRTGAAARPDDAATAGVGPAVPADQGTVELAAGAAGSPGVLGAVASLTVGAPGSRRQGGGGRRTRAFSSGSWSSSDGARLGSSRGGHFRPLEERDEEAWRAAVEYRLLPARSEIDALARVTRLLGQPSASVWPGGRQLAGWMEFGLVCRTCEGGGGGGAEDADGAGSTMVDAVSSSSFAASAAATAGPSSSAALVGTCAELPQTWRRGGMTAGTDPGGAVPSVCLHHAVAPHNLAAWLGLSALSGTPDATAATAASVALDLVLGLLRYDPARRMRVEEEAVAAAAGARPVHHLLAPPASPADAAAERADLRRLVRFTLRHRAARAQHAEAEAAAAAAAAALACRGPRSSSRARLDLSSVPLSPEDRPGHAPVSEGRAGRGAGLFG